jgi:chemotaxis protein MotB
MGSQQTAPIIVIRRKKGHGGHHGGAWKVAYADFVTALMALFIVLWLVSSSEKVKQAVQTYFQDPTGTGKLAGTTLSGKGEGLMVKPDDMAKLKDRIEQAMRQLPKFELLKNNITLTVTPEGLRIELLETRNGLFFDSGSAQVSPRGDEILRLLASQLKLLPNQLLLEGHTDAQPYASDTGYSNWELSTDRANTARRVFQACGVPMDKIAQVRGFADRQLRNRADPDDPANRRISVIVQYLPAPSQLPILPVAKLPVMSEPTASPQSKAPAALPPTAKPQSKTTAAPPPAAKPQSKTTAAPSPPAKPQSKATAAPPPAAKPQSKTTAAPPPAAKPQSKATAAPPPAAKPQSKATTAPPPAAKPQSQATAASKKTTKK